MTAAAPQTQSLTQLLQREIRLRPSNSRICAWRTQDQRVCDRRDGAGAMSPMRRRCCSSFFPCPPKPGIGGRLRRRYALVVVVSNQDAFTEIQRERTHGLDVYQPGS